MAGPYHDGGVLAYGSARFYGSPVGRPLRSPVVAMAATADGAGYWLATADGGVHGFGDARVFGEADGRPLASPVVTMAAAPDGAGYWLVSADGAVYSFGDARYFGAPAHVPSPVVGFAPYPGGLGYWMVTSHGAVYSFGAARYHGSLGATDLHNIPVVAMASSADGGGYWLVQGGGEVRAYGDAPSLGSLPRGQPPVDAIAVTPGGRGYWLLCGNGEVFSFGDARYHGGDQAARPLPGTSAIVAGPGGDGYWLLVRSAFEVGLAAPARSEGEGIVADALSQQGPSPEGGRYCNPYGPCEEWCALFATWAWESAGVRVPRMAFVGDVYRWARAHARVMGRSARPAPGDLVFYGTGPASARTSPHMGVVAQVWPDGEVDTVEGDAGPGPGGWTAVLVNGPFLPSQSFFANGEPIYAFAAPPPAA